jgi:uncharacterized RDD family membrane protein YckC
MISRTSRLLNFLIDSFVFLILVIVLTLLLKSFISRENLYWFFIIFYYFYYLILEGGYSQTVGKVFTKTKVVDESGNKASLLKIFLRTLLRVFPFDFISYLFSATGIHDKFSKTKLIKL